MDFDSLANDFVNRFGLNENLFDINFENVEIDQLDYQLRITVERRLSNYFFSSFRYKERTEENWNSIVLYAPKNRVAEVIDVLNDILREENENEVNMADKRNMSGWAHIKLL